MAVVYTVGEADWARWCICLMSEANASCWLRVQVSPSECSWIVPGTVTE